MLIIKEQGKRKKEPLIVSSFSKHLFFLFLYCLALHPSWPALGMNLCALFGLIGFVMYNASYAAFVLGSGWLLWWSMRRGSYLQAPVFSVSGYMLLGPNNKNHVGTYLGSGLACFEDFTLKFSVKCTYACSLWTHSMKLEIWNGSYPHWSVKC